MILLPYKHKGYIIRDPRPTGGKAGKYCNITSSVQIWKDDRVLKSIQYKIAEREAKNKAIEKAVLFIDKKMSKQP